MRLNKLFIVGLLLLTIMTIGVVSASEDLTQDNDTVVSADEITEIDEVPLSDDNSADRLSDVNDEFYVSIQENYTEDREDWDSNELIYISSYSQRTGNFTVSVDDVEKLNILVTDGHFSVEENGMGESYNKYFKDIYPSDLGLDCGSYFLKVNFIENENVYAIKNCSVTVKEREDFDIWLQNPYYCEEEYWSSPSFIVIDSNHANSGTLEIFVNGTRKISYVVANGSFEYIENCSNKSRYVAASDLFEGYGNYNVLINFTEDGVSKTLRDEQVVIGEFPPTTDPRLELYLEFYDLYLRCDLHAYIYLPREATGNLTITYKNNGQTFPVSYSKGYASYYINDYYLNQLGENEIIVKYTGDDFPELNNAVGIVNVHPGITIPNYVDLNEEFSISMTVYDWVNGDFEVYDYNDGVKGNLIASKSIIGGRSSATLSSNTSGLNKYYLHIDTWGSGVYDIVKEIYVVENSGNVTVDIPKEIEMGSNLTVKVNCPDIEWTFVQIKADDRDTDFLLVNNGEAIGNISNLTRGYHTVTVLYDNRIFGENGDLVGEVYLETFTVNVGVKTDIDISNVTLDYNSGENLTITLRDGEGNALSGKEISINFDGVNCTETTDSYGQVRLAVDKDPGNYTAYISFAGDEGYLSSSAAAEVNINKIKTIIGPASLNLTCTDGKTLFVSLKDILGNDLSNKTIRFAVNGTDDMKTTDDFGLASLYLDLLPNNYTVIFSFAGDERYLNSSGSVDVEVHREIVLLSTNSIINMVYGGDLNISFIKANTHRAFSNQNIIMTIGEIDYNVSTDENGQIVLPFDLPVGNYSARFRLVEDEKYELIEDVVYVNVTKANTRIRCFSIAIVFNGISEFEFELCDENNVCLSDKNVTIRVNGENVTNVTDENGVIKLSLLTKTGFYTIDLFFDGDSNYLPSNSTNNLTIPKLATALEASNVTADYKSEVNLTVTLKDMLGNPLNDKEITVSLAGQNFTRMTDGNGQINLPVSLDGGSYVANIRFAGDESFNESSADVAVIVNAITSKLTATKVSTVYNVAKNLVITLKDVNGKALAKKTVTIKLNGATYARTTDSNGQVKLSVNLPAKTYTASIVFGGDNNYKKSSATAKVTVAKATPKLAAKSKTFKLKAKTKKVTATLKDNKGRVMKSAKVTLKIKTKKYTVKTNNKGIATFNVKLTKNGSYTAKITYAGNSNYKSVGKTIKINVKK